MRIHSSSVSRTLLPALCGVVMLCGCGATIEKRDPLEPFNRMMWSVNKAADVTVLKPVSTIYNQVFPQFLRTGFYNMFANLREFITFPNQFLQGHVGDGWDTIGRIAINSTIGVAGFFDVASSWGNIPRRKEDFGQTLAVWGMGSGPYLFIPLFGPSNFRDGAALIPDLYFYPATWIDNVALQNSLYAASVVIVRADASEAMRFVNEAAVDEYAFLRDAFFQRRLNEIYNGNPPNQKLEDDDDDDKGSTPADKKSDAATPEIPQLAAAPIEVGGQPMTTESGAPIGAGYAEPVATEPSAQPD